MFRTAIYEINETQMKCSSRLLAEKGPAPPLGNFADIVYLKEQSFMIQMRDVCICTPGRNGVTAI